MLEVVVELGVVVDVVVVDEVDVDVDVVVVESSVDGDSVEDDSLLDELLTSCEGGGGKSSFGTSVSAADMKLCQIVAGRVPPVTVTPCTRSIGLLPSG